MLTEIESAWRETGIECPNCDGHWMTYSDGVSRPQCGNPDCLEHLTDEQIWTWLITEYRQGGEE